MVHSDYEVSHQRYAVCLFRDRSIAVLLTFYACVSLTPLPQLTVGYAAIIFSTVLFGSTYGRISPID